MTTSRPLSQDPPHGPLHIAVVCFPTFGGSGVVATEIALAMAERGHRVHVVARDVPVRLHAALGAHTGLGAPPPPHGGSAEGGPARVVFHEVPEPDAGPLPSNAYPIALAAKLVEVATWERIDVIHAHYAAPHATAAWMARDALAHACTRVGPGAERPPCAPKVINTLHGTDVTGAEPSHLAITRHALWQSDAVTAPSAFLAGAARDVYGLGDVEVIPNFVDTARYAPPARDTRAARLASGAPGDEGELVLLHVSNFRKVKRVGDVVAVFARVAAQRPARLVLVGDGPERSHTERRLRELGLGDRAVFLGKQEAFFEELAAAHVFLLPSESESFGLAALEAMSCGVPVVASDTGGLPDVVLHGDSGLLAPVGDVDAMAAHVLALADPAAWPRFSQSARARALAHFARGPAVDRYEALYRRVVS